MAVWRNVRVAADSQFEDLSIRKLLERYSGGSFSVRSTLDGFKQIPAAIEPDIGGRLMQQAELRPGDIVLATTAAPDAHGIPSQELAGRALICLDGQRVVDSTSGMCVETAVGDLLVASQTAAVFRIQVDTKAAQMELGTRLAASAAGRLGTVMSDSDIQAGRAAWVKVSQPTFVVDRYVFAPGGHWIGFVHLSVPRAEEGSFPFYCSWHFLDALDVAAKPPQEDRVFWFTVDDFVRSHTIKVFQPLGYIGHLKGPN